MNIIKIMIISAIIIGILVLLLIVIFGGDSNPFFVEDVNGKINAVCINSWENHRWKPAKHCWEITRQLF